MYIITYNYTLNLHLFSKDKTKYKNWDQQLKYIKHVLNAICKLSTVVIYKSCAFFSDLNFDIHCNLNLFYSRR